MRNPLQNLLFFFPLYKLSFLTSIPKELLYYEQIHEKIPENWLESPSLCIFHHSEQWDKLNQMEVSSILVQDPQLVGVIICSDDPVCIHDEILSLFQQCGIPLLQINDSNAQTWFQQSDERYMPFYQITLELKGVMENGFPHMAENMSKVLNTPILYVNHHNQIMWETGEEERLRMARRWINVHQRALVTPTSGFMNFEPITKDSFIAYPLEVPGQPPNWLIVSAELVAWQKQLMDKFSGLIALYLQSETQLQGLQERFRDHFVYDLLYHKFESHKVMIEQGKIWGWNLEKPHHLFLIDIDFSEEWDGEIDRITEIIGHIDVEYQERNVVLHGVPFDEQIVLLLEDDGVRTSDEGKKYSIEFAQELDERLSAKWGKEHFSIGIGKRYQESTYLNKSYQEAKMAIQFGKGWHKDETVFHYNDLGVLRILMHVHQGILADFSKDYLSVLMNSDREMGTEYMKTLQTLIQYRWKLEQVAEILFVHPNTLRNRVKRMEELLGIDFQDSEEFSNIMIAVKIYSFFD